jgi:hypothetical protein
MSETSHVEGNPVTAAAASSAGDAPTGAATVGTDAQYAPPSAIGLFRPLRNISEVRHFFRTNEAPVYFVRATVQPARARPLGPQLLLPTTTAGTVRTHGCLPRSTGRTSNSSPARRSTTGCW